MNRKKIAPANDPLLRNAEAAELLEISTSTLWKWAKDGKIPHIRYGREARFRKSGLIAWRKKRVIEEWGQGGYDGN